MPQLAEAAAGVATALPLFAFCSTVGNGNIFGARQQRSHSTGEKRERCREGGGMWNGNEMTMKHKTCHSLLKNYKISVEFATAIVKNFLPRGVGGCRVVTGGRGRGALCWW